ncbi:hypothetical protein ACJRO7_008201 [Eucalyptus globulus]|uniref:Uncharacterized protein n=1 Tax=Eucalyptus globulus TaxID=34317 RepID=A0ABD3IQJ7_EUCGL
MRTDDQNRKLPPAQLQLDGILRNQNTEGEQLKYLSSASRFGIQPRFDPRGERIRVYGEEPLGRELGASSVSRPSREFASTESESECRREKRRLTQDERARGFRL